MILAQQCGIEGHFWTIWWKSDENCENQKKIARWRLRKIGSKSSIINRLLLGRYEFKADYCMAFLPRIPNVQKITRIPHCGLPFSILIETGFQTICSKQKVVLFTTFFGVHDKSQFATYTSTVLDVHRHAINLRIIKYQPSFQCYKPESYKKYPVAFCSYKFQALENGISFFIFHCLPKNFKHN